MTMFKRWFVLVLAFLYIFISEPVFAAFTASAIWETENSGSDTINGGAFDFSQTAGMFTDGAATVATSTAPVFTSASYNFVAGDVGAWVFIGAGTNWTQGWYKIASVASNAATLNGTIGSAVLKSPVGVLSIVVGCATTASPTGATWSIDYSQQVSAQIAYTDIASVGTGLTATSAAHPFAKQLVGNCLVVTGGTNLNVGRYFLASVSGVTGTFIAASGNITTGAGVSGTGGLGGALATPGKMAALTTISGMRQFWKYNASSFTMSSSTPGAGGPISFGVVVTILQGYDTVRGDNTGNRPSINWGATVHGDGDNIITCSNNINQQIVNIKVDGDDTDTDGIVCTGARQLIQNCYVTNCDGGSADVGYAITAGSIAINCKADDCYYGFANSGNVVDCVALTCLTAGFLNQSNGASTDHCLAYSNTSDGFLFSATGSAFNCTSNGNSGDGFDTGIINALLYQCVSTYNSGYAVNGGAINILRLFKLADYTNTAGRTNFAAYMDIYAITLTGDPYVDRTGVKDFRPNNTSGAGALLRAAGVGISGQTNNEDIGGLQHVDPTIGYPRGRFGD